MLQYLVGMLQYTSWDVTVYKLECYIILAGMLQYTGWDVAIYLLGCCTNSVTGMLQCCSSGDVNSFTLAGSGIIMVTILH